jgi:hypothetical protein
MAYLRADAHDTPQRVVDNADATGVRYDPSVWHIATAQPGRYGASYLVASPRRTNSPVRFRLNVPATDRYDLMMRWPCGGDSARAGISVATTHGTRTAIVDESRGCSHFRYIGSFDLAAGSAWRLQVSSASRARGAIVADAFELIEQSDTSPPTAPVVTAHAGETGLNLSWTKGRDNIGVGGYRVVVDSALRYQGTARTLAVSGLACGVAHTVSVRALDMVSNLSPKALIDVRTTACPPPPRGLVAAPARGSVALTWSAPAAGLDYRVLANGRLITTTSATSYTVGGLSCATTHTFTVESADSSGGVSAPASVTLTMPAC